MFKGQHQPVKNSHLHLQPGETDYRHYFLSTTSFETYFLSSFAFFIFCICLKETGHAFREHTHALEENDVVISPQFRSHRCVLVN